MDHAQVIRDLFAAYARGDRPAMEALLTEDVKYHIPGRNQFSGDHVGPDAVIGVWAGQKAFLDGKPYEPHTYDLVVSDDHVIMLAVITARRGGDVRQFKVANVYRVVDGKVAEATPHVFDLYAWDEFWAGNEKDGQS